MGDANDQKILIVTTNIITYYDNMITSGDFVFSRHFAALFFFQRTFRFGISTAKNTSTNIFLRSFTFRDGLCFGSHRLRKILKLLIPRKFSSENGTVQCESGS